MKLKEQAQSAEQLLSAHLQMLHLNVGQDKIASLAVATGALSTATTAALMATGVVTASALAPKIIVGTGVGLVGFGLVRGFLKSRAMLREFAKMTQATKLGTLDDLVKMHVETKTSEPKVEEVIVIGTEPVPA